MIPSYHQTRPPTVIYLDDDPEVVATWYFDRHLLMYAGHCAQLLSAVWHREANYVVQGLGTHVLPGWRHDGGVRAQLFGTSIFPTMSTWLANPEHIDWAAALGGNYAWVRQLGLALLDEHLYRFPVLDPQARVTIDQLRAMLVQFEVMPTRLRETRWEFYEAPYVLAEFGLEGTTGPVTAYRRFYALGLRGVQEWTRRPRPDFVTQLLEEHRPLLNLP